MNLLVRLRFLCYCPIAASLFPPFLTFLPCRVFPFRHAVSFHSVLHGVARLRICAVMLHYIYRHRMANAKCGTVAVLSLMPVHDWSEDYASSVSSPVINRIPVSLSLSLRPASFPSLPYFSAMPCLSIPFCMESICAVMLHYIYRHRMANACSGTVPVLSLMLVHDWREDYASFVSSPVINRISVIFGLSLRPPLRGTTKKDLAGASQSQPDDGDRVAARCLTLPTPQSG